MRSSLKTWFHVDDFVPDQSLDAVVFAVVLRFGVGTLGLEIGDGLVSFSVIRESFSASGKPLAVLAINDSTFRMFPLQNKSSAS